MSTSSVIYTRLYKYSLDIDVSVDVVWRIVHAYVDGWRRGKVMCWRRVVLGDTTMDQNGSCNNMEEKSVL